MSYKVEIKNNVTGETRICDMDLEWKEDEDQSTVFWWTEGNFGCDCNRSIVFNGSYESIHSSCGGNIYTVVRAILPDGSEIKIDYEVL